MGTLQRPAYHAFLLLLRKAREEAGLLQEQAADRLNRTQSYVSKCERGERRVDVIELAEFARVYRKPIEFFLPPATSGAEEPERRQGKRRNRKVKRRPKR